MRYRESGSLDASGVRDTRGPGGLRGGGGRGIAVGGGGLGLVGLVVVILLQVIGGDGGGGSPVGAFSGLGQDQAVDNSALAENCRTGADANESVECAVVADVESIQGYWSGVLGEQYVPTETTFFTGSVQTACGAGDSGEPLIADITDDDIDRALDAASRIGDDYIQENLGGGTVDQEAFTHGSSEQRQKWFRTGYETGDPARCDTFATDDLG